MSDPDLEPRGSDAKRVIELQLGRLEQLVNSIDPAPFPEKDLDDDVEAFLVSWAKEYSDAAPLQIVIHVRERPEEGGADDLAESVIHHYFAYRAGLAKNDFRQLLRRGRTSLLIGLAFLAACLGASRALAGLSTSPLAVVAQESLIIGGWVAMWRPLEILLYDWWPLKRSQRIYEKLAVAPVVLEVDRR